MKPKAGRESRTRSRKAAAGRLDENASIVERILDLLQDALEVVDDTRLQQAAQDLQENAETLDEPTRKALEGFLQSLESRNRAAANAASRDVTARSILDILRARTEPIDQGTLAKAVYPSATEASAESMLSRKLDQLENDHLVVRIKHGKTKQISIGARARAAFGMREAARLHDELRLRRRLLPAMFRGNLAGLEGRVGVHVMGAVDSLLAEVLSRKPDIWTENDCIMARALCVLTEADEAQVNTSALSEVLSRWGERDTKRQLFEAVQDALDGRRRDQPAFVARVVRLRSQVRGHSSDAVVWARLASLTAQRIDVQAAGERRRTEVLYHAATILPEERQDELGVDAGFVGGFATHLLHDWRRSAAEFASVQRSPVCGGFHDEFRRAAYHNETFTFATPLLFEAFREYLRAEGAYARWTREFLTAGDVREILSDGWLERLALRSFSQVEQHVASKDVRELLEKLRSMQTTGDVTVDQKLREFDEVANRYRDMLWIVANPTEGAKLLAAATRPSNLSDRDVHVMALDLQYTLPVLVLRYSLPALWDEVRAPSVSAKKGVSRHAPSA